MMMVHSLSTIVLSLLEAEINLDPDFVKNQPASDGNLGHSMFKENLHKAHGIPHNARCEDFIAAEIISNPLKTFIQPSSSHSIWQQEKCYLQQLSLRLTSSRLDGR